MRSMTTTRPLVPRLVRGTAAGTAATFFALAFHLLADGATPAPLALLTPLVASVLVGVVLAGRSLSLARLAATVTAAQVLFHVLFVLGASAPHAVPTHAPAGSSGAPVSHAMPTSLAVPTGHAGHAAPVDLAPDAVADAALAGHAHGDLAMITAHLAAALLTIVLLHRGERALERVRAWADARLTRWTHLLTAAVPAIRTTPSDGGATAAPTPLGFLPGVCPAAAPRRGPPSRAPRTPMTGTSARSRAPPDDW